MEVLEKIVIYLVKEDTTVISVQYHVSVRFTCVIKRLGVGQCKRRKLPPVSIISIRYEDWFQSSFLYKSLRTLNCKVHNRTRLILLKKFGISRTS